MLEVHCFQKLQPYASVLSLQRQWRDERIQGLAPDRCLLLEHEACVTRGRGLQQAQAEAAGKRFEVMPIQNLPYFEIERGGDLTTHLPGQLVLYPIVDIRSFELWGDGSLSGFLRGLEETWMDLLKPTWHLSQKAGATGLWIHEKKVASLGIAVRRFVTMHGIAINVTNDLAPFQTFRPCGFDGAVMTRLVDYHPVTVSEVRDRFLSRVQERMRNAEVFFS